MVVAGAVSTYTYASEKNEAIKMSRHVYTYISMVWYILDYLICIYIYLHSEIDAIG